MSVLSGSLDPNRQEALSAFTLYWRDGRRDVVQGSGNTPADAMNRAGYSSGAVRALDFWAHGDDRGYVWNPQTREWDLASETSGSV